MEGGGLFQASLFINSCSFDFFALRKKRGRRRDSWTDLADDILLFSFLLLYHYYCVLQYYFHKVTELKQREEKLRADNSGQKAKAEQLKKGWYLWLCVSPLVNGYLKFLGSEFAHLMSSTPYQVHAEVLGRLQHKQGLTF